MFKDLKEDMNKFLNNIYKNTNKWQNDETQETIRDTKVEIESLKKTHNEDKIANKKFRKLRENLRGEATSTEQKSWKRESRGFKTRLNKCQIKTNKNKQKTLGTKHPGSWGYHGKNKSMINGKRERKRNPG